MRISEFTFLDIERTQPRSNGVDKLELSKFIVGLINRSDLPVPLADSEGFEILRDLLNKVSSTLKSL